MLIEMLGPSGVGKTTILDHAKTLRSDSPEWIAPKEADDCFASISKRIRRRAVDDPEVSDLVDRLVHLVSESSMQPSQKIFVGDLVGRSEFSRQAIRGCDFDAPVIHDELLLNRAFSLLLYSEDYEQVGVEYFRTVPLPDAAVVMDVSVPVLLDRVDARSKVVNQYHGLPDEGRAEIARRAVRLTDLAAAVLTERGIPVLRIRTGKPPQESARQLHDWIVTGPISQKEPGPSVRDRLLEVSQTFQKRSGRHTRRNTDVVYCSFHTRRCSVLPRHAQRDAVKRLAQFGLSGSKLLGKSVLDLGSYTGGMLLQLSNLGIERGLGIEYDQEKVTLAREIAAMSDLGQLEFRQGDIDSLDVADLGTFDAVFCLAIEAHVNDPERLYRLLGQVTNERLYFEGNSNCDVDHTAKQLRAAGFSDITNKGFSTDDANPANHNRPVLIATKRPTGAK